MDYTIAGIIAISFIATLIRSTFGFGESLVAVPLFILFLPIEIAVPLSVLLSVLIALIVVVQDHKQIQLNSAKWLILFALPGIPLGLAILLYGNELLVKVGLGTLMILYSLYALLGKQVIKLQQDNMFWLFICGFCSGVFGGAYGINGPPLVVYGNMRQWSAKHFRATLQAYFLPASLAGLAGYFIKGLFNPTLLKYFLIALPAAIPAVFLGRYFNHKLKDSAFFKYVYIGLILIGIFLIINTLYARSS
ncbi:sulfite exporter TauE/SafE family protein [Chitinophaga agrisoli]|uniref:Probable membrane transporter protein n=1 Tax=Chitinophaga agrisoli TaxID=2607653 RepID=A0A5B2VW17_9BACT|nr:sulfite exporter TauE/SafE family protein [Chitinophaga agrisoli]KAA2243501.1 sulfite exporter TauE/SafE family protein [Chitinophaga agrisoli]